MIYPNPPISERFVTVNLSAVVCGISDVAFPFDPASKTEKEAAYVAAREHANAIMTEQDAGMSGPQYDMRIEDRRALYAASQES